MAYVTRHIDNKLNEGRDIAICFFNNMQFMIIGVFISSILAFLVNLSTFLVIGKTSPVSYQVLGHSKLVVIIPILSV